MPAGLISRRPVAPVPVFTVALAAACWFASVWQMRGMDMGRRDEPSAFPV